MSQISSINLVTSTELYQLMITENIFLIDVRSVAEFNQEHIFGAILLPLDHLASVQVDPYQGRCIFYCRSGRRSHQAGEKLIKDGWAEVNHLEGGIQAWKELGYPTTLINQPKNF